jgi:hypothetical protein
MLSFLQGSAAHSTSSLLEQRSAGALKKLAYIYTVLQNNALLCRCMQILCMGVQIGSRAAVPAIRHSRIAVVPEGGGMLVIDPEMGKGQMLDGELCVCVYMYIYIYIYNICICIALQQHHVIALSL